MSDVKEQSEETVAKEVKLDSKVFVGLDRASSKCPLDTPSHYTGEFNKPEKSNTLSYELKASDVHNAQSPSMIASLE